MTAQECAAYVDLEADGFGPQLRSVYLNKASTNCFEDLRSLARDRNLESGYKWALVRLAKSNQPVFTYMFNHPQPGPNAARDGSFHGVETPYIFGLPQSSATRPFTQADSDVSERMMAYWSNFIKTGNPNGRGLPNWPSADPEKAANDGIGR